MQNNETYRIYENDVDRLFGEKLGNRPQPDAGNWPGLEARLDAHDKTRRKGIAGKWLLALLLLGGITTGTLLLLPNRSGKNNLSENRMATENVAPQNQQKDNTYIPVTPQTGNTTPQTASKETPVSSSLPEGMNPEELKKIEAPVAAKNHNPENQTAYTAPANTGGNPQFDNPANRGETGTPKNRLRTNNDAHHYTNPVSAKPNRRRQNTTNNTRNANTEPETLVAGESGDNTPVKPETTTNAPLIVRSLRTDDAAPVPTNNAVNQPEQATAGTVNPAGTENTNTAAMQADAGAAAKNGNGTAKAEIPKTRKTKKTRVRKEAPEHDFSSGQGQWFVEAFSGYNNSIKDNKSFAAFLAPSGYVDKRLNQENALVSLQAGVNLRYRKNHLVLGTGLSYLELGDMVRYDASVTGPVALDANGRSKLTYLEIPLAAGYEWASKRWGFSLVGGISAGVLMGARGQYISTSNFTSDLFDLNANKGIFRKTQLNLLATPSVNYFMNEQTNLFVAPLYRLNLQPVTITGASLNQKYYGMGIRVGIRTTLNR